MVHVSKVAGVRERTVSVAGACYCQSATAAASTTTVLSYSRLVTFRTGMTVLLILVRLRLQLARDSRHTVGLGTSTNKYRLVIVFYAVITYDRSIGTKEAGRGLFCITFASAGQTRGALSCRNLQVKIQK